MEHEDESSTFGNGNAAHLAEQGVERLQADFADLEQRTRRFVQEYPLSSLAAAVVGGYLLARLVSRM